MVLNVLQVIVINFKLMVYIIVPHLTALLHHLQILFLNVLECLALLILIVFLVTVILIIKLIFVLKRNVKIISIIQQSSRLLVDVIMKFFIIIQIASQGSANLILTKIRHQHANNIHVLTRR
jgi:hypothetical protein